MKSIARYYCEEILKPMEDLVKEMRDEVYCKKFVSKAKKEELERYEQLLMNMYKTFGTLVENEYSEK